MSRLIGLALLLVFPAFSLAAEDEALKKELERFKGPWIMESIEENGVKQSGEDIGDNRLMFTDDKYVQQFMKMVVEEGSIKLDPSKKPATIDLVIASGQDKGKTQLGIYEFSGDVLKICTSRPGNATRPMEFDGKKFIVFTLKREKK
jgi:uncharacterized protein (TIGR03067 family)